MHDSVDCSFEDSSPLLPSQYNDFIRRRSYAVDGEHRLMWAVLEDAIESYMTRLKFLAELPSCDRWLLSFILPRSER
jgi:hypothetical protein